MKTAKQSQVPSKDWIPPKGLSRQQAAGRVGVGTGTFDGMVSDGRMPSPIEINRRLVWDIVEIDEAFERLPRRGSDNPWDKIGF